MSDKIIDTEPGGESTQYESVQTVTRPPAKQTGQLGQSESTETSNKPQTSPSRGERTAENIRYGQKISEEGMGGTTTDNGGEANVDGGYGGSAEQSETTGTARSAQGYGGAQDASNDIGG